MTDGETSGRDPDAIALQRMSPFIESSANLSRDKDHS
jgi:hypothetical protein